MLLRRRVEDPNSVIRIFFNIVGEKQTYASEEVIVEVIAALEAICFNTDDSVVER
jgi:hypothetical protein